MDDSNRPVRRISKAYIFGLTNKPFKYEFPSGPRPVVLSASASQTSVQPVARPPTVYTQSVSRNYPAQARAATQGDKVPRPGDMTAWIASDGRRGTVTSTSKGHKVKQVVSRGPTPAIAAAVAATNKAAGSVAARASSAPEVAPATTPPSKPTPAPALLMTPTLASVPVPEAADASEQGGGLLDLFNEPSIEVKSVVSKQKDKDDDKDAGNPHSFTADQDKRLLEWKDKNPSGAWATIGEELGKQGPQCKDRFNQIKPKDWKPAAAAGGENNGNKGKGKGNKKEQSGKEDIEKKDEMSQESQRFGGDNPGKWDDSWNNINNAEDWPNSGKPPLVISDATWDAGTKNKWNSSNTGGSNTDRGRISGWNDNSDAWGKNANKDNDDGNAWNNDNKTSAVAGWDSIPKQDTRSNANESSKSKSKSKAASKAGTDCKSHHSYSKSHRRSSHGEDPETKSSSKHKGASSNAPVEVAPDKNFSGQDLRILARILQRDSAMVWQRASYRFKDSTGRDIPPEVIRRKVKGIEEDEESEEIGEKEKKQKRKGHGEEKERKEQERKDRKRDEERRERKELKARHENRYAIKKSQEWGNTVW